MLLPKLIEITSFIYIIKINLLVTKASFRQINNRSEKVLKTARLADASIRKDISTFQKLGSRDIWRIVKSVLSKCKSAIPPLFNSPEVLHLMKRSCLLKVFQES